MSQFMPSGVTQDVPYEFIKTYPESPALAVHELFLAGGFPYAAFAEAPQAGDSIYTYLTDNYGGFGVADMVNAIYQRDGYVEGSFAAMRDVIREGAANGMTLADVLCELVSFDSERMGCTLREYLSRVEFRRSGAQLSCTFDAQSRLTSFSLRLQLYTLLWSEDGSLENYEPYTAIDIQADISYDEVAVEAPSADRLLPELGEPVEQGGEWLIPVEWNGVSAQNSRIEFNYAELGLYDQDGLRDWEIIDDSAVLDALTLQVTEEGIVCSVSAETEELLRALAEDYFDIIELRQGQMELVLNLYLIYEDEEGRTISSDYTDAAVPIELNYEPLPQFTDFVVGEDGSFSLSVEWNGVSPEQIGIFVDFDVTALASNGVELHRMYYVDLPTGFDWAVDADGFVAEGDVIEAAMSETEFTAWVRSMAATYRFDFQISPYIVDEASGERLDFADLRQTVDVKGDGITLPVVDEEGIVKTEDGATIPVDWNEVSPEDVELTISTECILYGEGGNRLGSGVIADALGPDALEKSAYAVTLSLGMTWEEFVASIVSEDIRAYATSCTVDVYVDFTYIDEDEELYIAGPYVSYTQEMSAAALLLPQFDSLSVRADGTVLFPVDWKGGDPADFGVAVNYLSIHMYGGDSAYVYLYEEEIPAAFAWEADAEGLKLSADALPAILQLFEPEALETAYGFDVEIEGYFVLCGGKAFETELDRFWGYFDLDENGDPVPTEPVPDPDDPEQPEEAVLYPYFEMVTLGEDGAIMTTVAWNDFPPERCSFGFMAEVIYLDEDLEAVGGAEGYWVIYPEDLTAAADGTLRVEGVVDWAAEHKPAAVEGEAYYFISCIFQMSVTDESGEIISIVEHGAVLLIDAR